MHDRERGLGQGNGSRRLSTPQYVRHFNQPWRITDSSGESRVVETIELESRMRRIRSENALLYAVSNGLVSSDEEKAALVQVERGGKVAPHEMRTILDVVCRVAGRVDPRYQNYTMRQFHPRSEENEFFHYPQEFTDRIAGKINGVLYGIDRDYGYTLNHFVNDWVAIATEVKLNSKLVLAKRKQQ